MQIFKLLHLLLKINIVVVHKYASISLLLSGVIVIKKTSVVVLQRITFEANHPFVYFVQCDKQLLFEGRLNEF